MTGVLDAVILAGLAVLAALAVGGLVSARLGDHHRARYAPRHRRPF